MLGQSGRARHHLGDERQKAGIGIEQGEKLDAGGKARQKLVKPPERRIGVRRGAEDPQQLRDELGEDLARSLTASGSHSAVVPAADKRGYRSRLAKTEPRKCVERLRVVVGAGENEIPGAGERGRLLEELGIMS